MQKNYKLITKMLKLGFKLAPGCMLALLGQALYNCALTVYNVYSLKWLLDALTNRAYEQALYVGGALVAINLLFNFLNHLTTRGVKVATEKLRKSLDIHLSRKLMETDYANLEDPQFLDLKERAIFAINNQGALTAFFITLGTVFQDLISMISLAVVIVSFNGWILLIMLGAAGVTVLVNISSLRFMNNFYKDLIPINRRFNYYFDGCLMQANFAKDCRLYSIGDLITTKVNQYLESINHYFLRFAVRQASYESLSKLANYAQQFVVYLIIAVKAFNEHLGVGSFTLYLSSAISFASKTSEMLTAYTEFLGSCNFLRPYVELLDMAQSHVDTKTLKLTGEIKTIEFQDVSFRYPHTDKDVLQHISFKVQAGEKISIVGLNGAGKTTLIKLLCRLYQPTSGTILVNGVDIQAYNYESYKQELAAVYQDFKLFAYTLGENIANDSNHAKEAYHYACEVGLQKKIDSLPHGIESAYSKAYYEDGVELSGGEAQKIAIARALYKKASLVILDEPTSALDPLAEADIYQNFNELVANKTALYISHRMSSSTFCDKILVINNGKVEAFEPHTELMKKPDSLYYKLFMSQAKNYELKQEV